jgi:protein-tyrosine phosphatase
MKPSIYRIPGPWLGELAILARPRGCDWLEDEIRDWRDAGLQVIVSLLAADETLELGLAQEADMAERCGLRFISFPIEDYGVPTSENAVEELVAELEGLLADGKHIGIHCRQGIGRSSLVTACLLVKAGQNVDASFQQISDSRGLTVPDTADQRKWVGDFARSSHVA